MSDYSALPKMAVEDPPGSEQFQKATVSEQVAALREKGIGDQRWWCEEHELPAHGADSQCLSQYMTKFFPMTEPCRIVPVLVVRIDGETP